MAEQQSVQSSECDIGPLGTQPGDGVEAEVQDSCIFWKSGGDVGQIHLGATDDVTGAYTSLVAVQRASNQLCTGSHC